jgi:hypothetical protein
MNPYEPPTETAKATNETPHYGFRQRLLTWINFLACVAVLLFFFGYRGMGSFAALLMIVSYVARFFGLSVATYSWWFNWAVFAIFAIVAASLATIHSFF